jgi:glyoxylase-like metal-dependent hydrolase (beta-lactamase superfamily II)
MIKPWHVGDLVIHRLTEDEYGYTTVDRFLPNLRPEVLEANFDWFSKDGLDPRDRTVFMTYSSYVVQTPQHRVLIDTCLGNGKTHHRREAWNNKADTRWLDEFRSTGLREEDIDYVLCTHLHFDHVGWNTRYERGRWVPTFPNARHLVVDTEFSHVQQFIGRGDDPDPLTQSRALCWQESIEPVSAAGQVDLVPANHKVGDYLRLIPAHGHTPGHVAVGAGREGDVAVFTGDLIHSPMQALYPDIYMPFDTDKPRAAATRGDFLGRYSDTDTIVFTMHFPAPSAGYIRPWREGYRLEYLHP